MTRPLHIQGIVSPKTTEADHLRTMDEMMFVALPMPTVKALSDAASARNMTFAQVLAAAIDEFLKKTESRGVPSGPRMLTEG